MTLQDILLQQLANGLILGSFYALVALGYTMVYGIIKLLNFAHGDLYMLGAFVGFLVLSILSPVVGDKAEEQRHGAARNCLPGPLYRID